jgi:hypothetical protein
MADQNHTTEEDFVARRIYEIDPLNDPAPLSWDEAQKYQHAIRHCRERARVAIAAVDEYRNG